MFSIILSACVCGFLIYKIHIKLEQTPISLSYSEAKVSEIPFPAVTICPETKVSSRIMDFTKVYEAINKKSGGKEVNNITKDKYITLLQ